MTTMPAALVLLVDDVVENVEMYTQYLEFCGYGVERAENGLEAVKKARDLRPQVIVMDLSMPQLDGWAAATRALKADPATAGIRVIVLTGYALKGMAEAAEAAGADAYVVKPCLPEHLEALIRQQLGAR